LFERVKDQRIAVQMLTHELRGNRLPGTLLFYGPDGTGKFLTAVELARVVNCPEGGKSDCTCRSCAAIKNLISKNLFIISRANLSNTFHLWHDYGVTEKNLLYFLRDVRRLVYSFMDEAGCQKEIQTINEIIIRQQDAVESVEEIIEIALSMLNSSKQRLIGIDRIREIQKYLSLRGDEKAKFVIIDGAENMTEQAANSFLKISEDTPEHALIVLTALKRESLKETILSRCRIYRFTSLGENTAADIRRRLFPGSKGKTFNAREKRMESYYKKIAGADMYTAAGLIREIADNQDAGAFFDFIIKILIERIRSNLYDNIEQLDTVSGHIKRISFLKKGVLVHHMNMQLALTDFLLNNFPEIISYLSKPLNVINDIDSAQIDS